MKQTSSTSSGPLSALLSGVLKRFTVSQLLTIAAVLFALDLVLIDPLPFIDEIFLAVITTILAAWKIREGNSPKAPSLDPDAHVADTKPPPRNVTPPMD
ncbi:MAG: DUF6116 family protein [Acidobacteriota bacterium]